jgi:hypothetical protein
MAEALVSQKRRSTPFLLAPERLAPAMGSNIARKNVVAHQYYHISASATASKATMSPLRWTRYSAFSIRLAASSIRP